MQRHICDGTDQCSIHVMTDLGYIKTQILRKRLTNTESHQLRSTNLRTDAKIF